MRSIQTSLTFPLASVKPLDELLAYRAHCIQQTRRVLAQGARRREHSPVGGARLEPFGVVEGLEYLRDPETGSVFLADLPDPSAWAHLLADVVRFRNSPEVFDAKLVQSRADHVYVPKLEWIQDTLRMQQVRRPRIMDVSTSPSPLTPLLREHGTCAEVLPIEETVLAHPTETHADPGGLMQAAVLLESLDRSDDPEALLRGVASWLEEGGLLFVTALVVSGFDLSVLGIRNQYLYPPDRTNVLSLQGLESLIRGAGFAPLEVSTPGVLDLEIIQAHLEHDPSIPLSTFERRLMEADAQTHEAFQAFLQEHGLSSFARIVARKQRT